MICVIGDGFVDRYWVGHSTGLSAEVPIPKVQVETTFDLPGGALNVRENLLALGENGKYLFVPEQNYPIKNRLIVDGQQIARWDQQDECKAIQPADLVSLLEVSAIVVCDYGKGSITNELVEILVGFNGPIFVDTKRDPSCWLPAGEKVILFPNLKEYKQFEEAYVWFPKVLLKQGALGMSWVEYGNVVLTRGAKTTNPVCVNGAGDTVVAAFASMWMSGANLDQCLEWANKAAAVVVQKPFTATTTVDEIYAI